MITWEINLEDLLVEEILALRDLLVRIDNHDLVEQIDNYLNSSFINSSI